MTTDTTPVEVQKFLNNLDYPATKDELIEHAESRDAKEEVINALQRLPDKEYRTPVDVTKAMRK